MKEVFDIVKEKVKVREDFQVVYFELSCGNDEGWLKMWFEELRNVRNGFASDGLMETVAVIDKWFNDFASDESKEKYGDWFK